MVTVMRVGVELTLNAELKASLCQGHNLWDVRIVPGLVDNVE